MHRRIEICGGIASGKTTLANVLRGSGYGAIFENFRENPFWRLFYENPGRFAFETEITFLLQHFHQIRVASERGQILTCDFSILLDLAYADINLKNGDYNAFIAVYEQVLHRLGAPSLLVLLRCGSAEELQRIRRRARAEERAVQLDYLSKINLAVEARVKQAGNKVRVLAIDSEHNDFANEREVQDLVVAQIREAID